jgi:FAD:protein FMN transferase
MNFLENRDVSQKRLWALCLVAVMVISGAAWSEELAATAPNDKRYATLSDTAMGTNFEILLYPPTQDMMADAIIDITSKAFASIHQLENHISTWIPESDTSRVNREAPKGPVRVSSALFRVLTDAKEVYAATSGAFDITVGPLLDLWGFYKKEGNLPSSEEMAVALKRVGLEKVTLDEDAQTVAFSQSDMRLDFGGIGKGMALDWAAFTLKHAGVETAQLHAGTSTIVAVGNPPGEAGWKVRIRNPYNTEREWVDEVVICDESLSTSSGAEKFFTIDGKKYCHIFDPRTGKPAEGVLSATAIAPTGTWSDALSTAFFIFGVDKTTAYCKAHPGVRAILVIEGREGPKVVRIGFSREEE